MTLLVCVGRSDADRLQLADVVVHETRWSTPVADAVAAATLRLLPGCALVAVGLTGGGGLLRSRFAGDRAVVVRAGGDSTEQLCRLAGTAHALLVRAAVTAAGARDRPPADPRCVGRPRTPADGADGRR